MLTIGDNIKMVNNIEVVFYHDTKADLVMLCIQCSLLMMQRQS